MTAMSASVGTAYPVIMSSPLANLTPIFAVVGGKLSLVIYWRVAHYLGKRHRCSIAKMMRDYYARDPKTGCKGWFTPLPGKPLAPDNRLFIWHKVPLCLQPGSNRAKTVQDQRNGGRAMDQPLAAAATPSSST